MSEIIRDPAESTEAGDSFDAASSAAGTAPDTDIAVIASDEELLIGLPPAAPSGDGERPLGIRALITLGRWLAAFAAAFAIFSARIRI